MKERILYDDEFEKQLKEKADQFKMYPSDKVWSDVYSSMHTRRRRFVVGMSFLIGGILFLAGTQLIFPSKNIHQQSSIIKMAAPVKPSTIADIRKFNTSALTAETNGDEGTTEAADTHTNAPFIGSDESDQSVSSEKIQSLPETIQNTSRGKTIQADAPAIAERSEAPLTLVNMDEMGSSRAKSVGINNLSADLDPETATSRLPYMRNDRFSWEIYVAPTVNTHYLNGVIYPVSQSLRTSPIMIVHYANVNGFVDNTAALGYDVGGNILYRISKNISLKAGIDFSFNRYYIRTYNSSRSSAATLNSYLYVPDSVANFSNQGGGNVVDKNPTHYQNMYYQLSVPVGVEMKVAGKGKLQLHIGATIQPSYLLNTDSYVLTNDFSSYTKNAEVFRRWNMNAGGEAFISYGVGKLRWELGPQIRYQIYSTYKDSYPLKENMLTYGIRFGITKTIR